MKNFLPSICGEDQPPREKVSRAKKELKLINYKRVYSSCQEFFVEKEKAPNSSALKSVANSPVASDKKECKFLPMPE